MKKWHFIIDVAKCENCNNCFLACKDEHCGNAWPGCAAAQPPHGQRWMNILRKERGVFPTIDVAYLPKPCMHCDDAPCIKAGRNKAVYKRDDGLVIIDPEKAVGQKQLVKACPYGAIWWNAEQNLPQKCTGCAHLLDDGWKAPRCVQACPTGALSFHGAETNQLAVLRQDPHLAALGRGRNPTLPRVLYKNLHRYVDCFVAGSLARRRDGIEDCLAGARVCLRKGENLLEETRSDAFGDFKFDGLTPDSGTYDILIDEGSSREKAIQVEIKSESVTVGTIWIGPATPHD